MNMPRIDPKNLKNLERSPTSPGALTNGIRELFSSSTTTKAKVESYNWETGEYRIVLQGTLDVEDTKHHNA